MESLTFSKAWAGVRAWAYEGSSKRNTVIIGLMDHCFLRNDVYGRAGNSHVQSVADTDVVDPLCRMTTGPVQG
jgi:hypothetical protein